MRGYRFVDRRTGFDRRRRSSVDALRVSSAYASTPLLGLLGLLNVFSFLDWHFTSVLLTRGAAEANPFMASLFGASPLAAGVVKVLIMLWVTLSIWAGRRYRVMLQFALVATAGFALLLVYQVAGLTLVFPAT